MCFARCIIVIMIIAGETEDLVQGLDFARILCVHAPNATSNALEFYQKAIYYYGSRIALIARILSLVQRALAPRR